MPFDEDPLVKTLAREAEIYEHTQNIPLGAARECDLLPLFLPIKNDEKK